MRGVQDGLIARGERESRQVFEMTAGHVTHVMLGVSDMTRSLAFYEGSLGRPVRFRAQDEFVFIDGGGLTIGLSTALGRLRQPLAGATEIVFRSECVRADARALAAAGVPVVREARQATPQGDWAVTVSDPDGHYVTLFGAPGED